MANQRSFQLLRTNPALTGNVKVVVDSNYRLYLESYNANRILAEKKYKNYSMYKEQLYDLMIGNFFYGLSNTTVFETKFDNDESVMKTDYKNQFDPIYYAGASNIEDTYYKEEFEYHAPLYIKPDRLPEGFVILRVDDPVIFDTETGFVLDSTNKENFRPQIIDKWKAVSLFDMTLESDFGGWLNLNFVDNINYPTKSFEFDAKDINFSKWYGLDYKFGVWSEKSKNIDDVLYLENPHFKLERFITDMYKESNMIFPHIVNFKFLFDDTPASPFELKKWTINRYYGFYIDQLEEIKYLTSYDPPMLVDGVTIENNIFVDVDNVLNPIYPFKEEFDGTKKYFIYAVDDLYEVKRVKENGNWIYKIIADFDIKLEDIDNSGVVDIEYHNEGREWYENKIKGRYVNLDIDSYDLGNGDIDGLYSDLYLIKIDEKFHVLKHRNLSDDIGEDIPVVKIFEIKKGSECVTADQRYIFIASGSTIEAYDWENNLLWEETITATINHIYLDNNFLYVGTTEGIYIKNFQIPEGDFDVHITTLNSNLPDNNVYKIYSKEGIIVASLFYDYEGEDVYQWWSNYTGEEINQESGLFGNRVLEEIKAFSIYGNDLYMAIDEELRKIYNFNRENYLTYSGENNPSIMPDSTINDVYVDDNGIIYAGTSKGLWIKNGPFEKVYNNEYGGYDLGSEDIEKIQIDVENGRAFLFIDDKFYVLNYFLNTSEEIEDLDGLNDGHIDIIFDRIVVADNDKTTAYNLPVSISSRIGIFDYYLNTDYAIDSDKERLRYWIESDLSEHYKEKPIMGRDEPLKYPIYRVKFSEVKDFDFDRVDTRFSEFDYRQNNEYKQSPEHKLYAVEYRDENEPKSFKTYPYGKYEDNIMNVSSEYIATDELWEISKEGRLNRLWRKNQSICKWGATDSTAHGDYVYKLNNSYKVGSVFNRTVDCLSNDPAPNVKNLDYFYRVGTFWKRENGEIKKKHYYNQATNIETDLMNPDSYKFNLDNYLNCDFDYFSYFFDNYMYQRINNIDWNLKSTKKYSIFNNADIYEPSSTIFNGLYYQIFDVRDITYEDDGLGGSVVKMIDKDSRTNYNGYKFSVIFNPVYDYQPDCGHIDIETAKRKELDNKIVNPICYYDTVYTTAVDFVGEETDPKIRGEYQEEKLTLDNYTGLTYYKDKETRISILWEEFDFSDEKDEIDILYLKNSSRLFLKVPYEISGITLEPIKETVIDTRGEFVLLSGSTFYLSEEGEEGDFQEILTGTTGETFICLDNWDDDDFLANIEDWKSDKLLYKIDNELVNGGIIDTDNKIDNKETSIDIFVNDCFGNAMIIINTPMTIRKEVGDINNLDYFGENEALYFGLNYDENNKIKYSFGDFYFNVNDGFDGEPIDGNLSDAKGYGDFVYFRTSAKKIWKYNKFDNKGEIMDYDGIDELLYITEEGEMIMRSGETLIIYNIETGDEMITGSTISNMGFGKSIYDKTNRKVYFGKNSEDLIWEWIINDGVYNEYVSGSTFTGYTFEGGLYDFYKDEYDDRLYVLGDSSYLWGYFESDGEGTKITNSDIEGFIGGSWNGVENKFNFTEDFIYIMKNNLNFDYTLYKYSKKENKILETKDLNGYYGTNIFPVNFVYNGNKIYKFISRKFDNFGTLVSIHSIVYENLETKNEFTISKTTPYTEDADDYHIKFYKINFIGNQAHIVFKLSNYDEDDFITHYKIFDEEKEEFIYESEYKSEGDYGCVNPEDYFSEDINSLEVIGDTVYHITDNNFLTVTEFEPGYEYKPENILARSFIDTINSVVKNVGFDRPVRYHHIDYDKNYNLYDMSEDIVPPFVMQLLLPQAIELKKNSLEVTAINGPDFDISNYQKPNQRIRKEDIIKEPLARHIDYNTEEKLLEPTLSGEEPDYYNVIFRYNGDYEPVFKDINLFNKIDYNPLEKGTVYDSGYKFDDSYRDFGKIGEIVYSKVNENGSVLKLRFSDSDRSVYPMVDEFAYALTDRFIFSSTWDKDFYIKTNKDIE